MVKPQVFFIHGAEAYSRYEDFLADLRTMPLDPFKEPSKRWTHTLREDLGSGYEVFQPAMPNKQNAKYEEWRIWFERHFEFLRDGVVLVGWSCGGYFLAKYLIENPVPFRVGHLFLIAAPFKNIPAKNGEDGGDFAFDTTRVGELTAVCDDITIMHSTDDFVVPYEHAKRYHAALPSAKLVTFHEHNHFLIAEFPELIEQILAL